MQHAPATEVMNPNRPTENSPSEAAEEKVVRAQAGTLTAEKLQAFRAATCTEYAVGVPPTLATIYRASEFEWLARLNIDMRQLLHTDQEYEYRVPFEEGDRPAVATIVKEFRERRGMQFYVLESEIVCNGVVKMVTRSSFIVRRPE